MYTKKTLSLMLVGSCKFLRERCCIYDFFMTSGVIGEVWFFELVWSRGVYGLTWALYEPKLNVSSSVPLNNFVMRIHQLVFFSFLQFLEYNIFFKICIFTTEWLTTFRKNLLFFFSIFLFHKKKQQITLKYFNDNFVCVIFLIQALNVLSKLVF